MTDVPPGARDRIMAAAVELAAHEGIHRVTMSGVAARANVSRPTLYGYFPDVAHVLEAWVDHEVSRVQDQLQHVLAGDGDPIDVLSAYIDVQLRYFADSPTRALITPAAIGSPPQSVARHIERFETDVRGLLEALHDDGRLRPDVDLDLLAALVIAGINAVAPHVAGGRLAAVEARTRLLDLLLRGAVRRDEK